MNCIGGGKVDGPSAGAAITCLIYSALMDKPARMDTCITGEISIRGNIKAVGGIREKIHAAKRHGFKHVIIPQENAEEILKHRWYKHNYRRQYSRGNKIYF